MLIANTDQYVVDRLGQPLPEDWRMTLCSEGETGYILFLSLCRVYNIQSIYISTGIYIDIYVCVF